MGECYGECTFLKLCTVGGCLRPLVARGFCQSHYQIKMKNGEFSPRRKNTNPCKVEGCKIKVYARELCRPHYERAFSKINCQCAYPGCEEKTVIRRKFCRHHFDGVEQDLCKEPNCLRVRAMVPDYGYCQVHLDKKALDKALGVWMSYLKYVKNENVKGGWE